jgi:hypothetical protein
MSGTSLSGMAETLRRMSSSDVDASRRHQTLDTLVRRAGVDDALRDAGLLSKRRWPRRARPRRVLFDVGYGSYYLARIRSQGRENRSVQLVEKALPADSRELAFWRAHEVDAVATHGRHYQALRPLLVLERDGVGFMYFPYVAALDQDTRLARQHFRANLRKVTTAAAEFAYDNLTAAWGDHAPQITKASGPPSTQRMRRLLHVTSPAQARLLGSIHRDLESSWPDLLEDYQRLPIAMAHNDLGPGNAFVVDGAVHLLDFAKAGVAPLGSDLHTLIRWSGTALTDIDAGEEIIGWYHEALRSLGCDVNLDDVRLAAWVTFFMRYSNLRWRSSRRLDVYSLALVKLRELCQERGWSWSKHA